MCGVLWIPTDDHCFSSSHRSTTEKKLPLYSGWGLAGSSPQQRPGWPQSSQRSGRHMAHCSCLPVGLGQRHRRGMGHRVCSTTSLAEGGKAETQSREGTRTLKSVCLSLPQLFHQRPLLPSSSLSGSVSTKHPQMVLLPQSAAVTALLQAELERLSGKLGLTGCLLHQDCLLCSWCRSMGEDC